MILQILFTKIEKYQFRAAATLTILSDGQVWFYDGIDTGRNLIYNGSINSNPPYISHYRGKQAVAAIYIPCLD